ncbi:hypothetical protein JCM6882_002703 [Rhodosporidiobolus microsporus]
MSRYRRPDSSSSHREDGSHRRSLAPSSANADPEAAAIAARVEVLSSRLAHAQAVLRWSCSTSDPFAAMALGTFDKAMRELESAVQLVDRARKAGMGVARAEPFPSFSTFEGLQAERFSSSSKKGESKERDDAHHAHGDEPASGRRSAAPPSFECARPPSRSQPDVDDFDPFSKKNRPRSAYGQRAESPPPALGQSRDPIPPASPSPTSPVAPVKAPLPPSRPPSRPASRVDSPPPLQRDDDATPPAPPAGIPSFSRFFKRGNNAVSPPAQEQDANAPLSPPLLAGGFGRPSSRSSEKGLSKGDIRRPPSVASSSHRRHRRVASDSSDEPLPPAPEEEKRDAATGYGRARSRSIAAGTSGRASSARSEEAQRALSLASAPPPEPEDEPAPGAKAREPLRLDGEKVAMAIATAVGGLEGAAGRKTLLALALVSKAYNNAATAALYASLIIPSSSQLDKLERVFTSNPSLGELVTSLTILPLDGGSSASSPDVLIPPLQRLLFHLPNLRHLDEDFTSADWDVPSLASGKDYILTLSPSSPKKLVSFRSARCWWEIGALHQLLVAQPHLKRLVLGGAAMDRDWEGQKLLASLSSAAAGPAPARNLETLEVVQCMHEDTLAVLLRSCGGGREGQQPSLRNLRIGFQSIGSTDDDTPRASIPSALALVGSSLAHLSITAPSKGSDDTTGLLDECLAVLPSLQVLEFSEQTDLLPVPIGSSKTLTLLPKTLRVLRARCVVSVSTSKVLSMLDDAGEVIPQLREVDVEWAMGTGEEEGKEPWWKERHVGRIEEACEDLGIKCRVAKGDERLVFGAV